MVDFIYKFGMLVAAAIGAAKLLAEVRRARHSHLREEYRFAREFLADVSSRASMHPFLKQKGYQAIAGDMRLSAAEIDYLLNIDDGARALKDYVLGRKYLEYKAIAADVQIVFKRKYQRPWSRKWRKFSYVLMYLVLFGLAGLPVLFPEFGALQPVQKLAMLLMSVAFLVPLAFLSLEVQFRMTRAEALVHSQRNRRT